MQEKLEKYLKRKVNNNVFPGCNYYIYCENEEFIGSIGNKALEPNIEVNDIDTLYDIASLSKVLVTNFLVSLLLQEEKIKLDDKVCSYLPKFKYDNVLILHLLTHSSGIKVLYDKNNIKSKEEFYTNIELMHKPGEDAIYSDINFILLGFIVEKIYGDSIDVLAHKYIFSKLDMNDTMYNPEDKLRCAPTEVVDNNVIRGIVHDEKARYLKGISGNAGVFTTIRDISKFVKLVLNDGVYNGKHIIDKKYIDLWFTPLFIDKNDVRRTIGWAYGKSSCLCNKFCSDDTIVHTGFTGCHIIIDRANELGIVILSNRIHPTRDNIKIFNERVNIDNYIYKLLVEYNKIYQVI